jgi:hypothetical protein
MQTISPSSTQGTRQQDVADLGCEVRERSKGVPIARKESTVSVFKHCECTETVIFQFEYSLWIIEGPGLTA